MEKSVEWEFDTYMQEIFQMKEVDIKEYSPLTLAYIGDCIYDLIIKTLVMKETVRYRNCTRRPALMYRHPHSRK